jgi:hypothetical protein
LPIFKVPVPLLTHTHVLCHLNLVWCYPIVLVAKRPKTVQASGPQNCRSITVYINIDLAFKPQFMVPSFSYVARGYKLGVWMQDLVSERDQSWVTGDAILHTLIIPQFGKKCTMCFACIIQSAAIRQISLCCIFCFVWCNHCMGTFVSVQR